MATMADLDELALSLPQTTKKLTSDGRPEYYVHDKLFCCHRGVRKDARDAKTGDRLDDVIEELEHICAESGSPPLAAPIGHKPTSRTNSKAH